MAANTCPSLVAGYAEFWHPANWKYLCCASKTRGNNFNVHL